MFWYFFIYNYVYKNILCNILDFSCISFQADKSRLSELQVFTGSKGFWQDNKNKLLEINVIYWIINLFVYFQKEDLLWIRSRVAMQNP